MLKKQRASYVLHRLNELYPSPPVPLIHKDIYTLLIAVLLSAQCTDSRVNQITPALFKKAGNPRDMSTLPIKDIYDIIRPCGLAPQKSKAISGLSSILVEKFNGVVPEDITALESLPGVGHKTASVVISQGFGHPAFAVDTHIHRLAQRWGFTNGRSVTQTEKDLKFLFPKKSWSALHLQFIYFGREFCSAWSCDGTICEICTTLYPNRKKPLRTKKS